MQTNSCVYVCMLKLLFMTQILRNCSTCVPSLKIIFEGAATFLNFKQAIAIKLNISTP